MVLKEEVRAQRRARKRKGGLKGVLERKARAQRRSKRSEGSKALEEK